LFEKPDKLHGEPFEVDFFGLRYRGNTGDEIDWQVYYLGAHEGEQLHLIGRILAQIRNPIVLDVGANTGHQTLFAAKFASKVIAVEPFANVAARIDDKISDNHQQTYLSVGAASVRQRTASIFINPLVRTKEQVHFVTIGQCQATASQSRYDEETLC